MKKLFLIIVITFTCISLNSQNQTLLFDVVHKGKSIGTLKAEKIIEGDATTYTSDTDIEFHMLMTIKIQYMYAVVYKSETLDNAKVLVMLKGHERTNVKTVKDGYAYTYFSDNKKVKEINEEITNSVEKLFFEEPIGVSKVYAEEHGVFHDIKSTKAHSYVKTAANGLENTYVYKDGMLQQSDVDAGVIAFSIVRKD